MRLLTKDNIRLIKVIVGLIVFVYYFLNIDRLRNEAQNNIYKNLNFKGVVVEKYIDKFERSTPVIVFNNNQREYIKTSLYNELNINDSVVKEKNSLIVTIYRSDSIYSIRY